MEEKEGSLKKKVTNYLKGLGIVFMASLPIMLYCDGLFTGDVSDHILDSSNYEYTPRNLDKRNNSQRLMDAFNRSEQI